MTKVFNFNYIPIPIGVVIEQNDIKIEKNSNLIIKDYWTVKLSVMFVLKQRFGNLSSGENSEEDVSEGDILQVMGVVFQEIRE